MSDEKKQIGRILLKRHLISQEELDRQLEVQRNAHDGVPLASRLLASGVVSETDILRALSEQFGVPGIDLHKMVIPASHLELVPREVAESSRVLPVLARDERLFLAMANPRDKRVIDELEFVTGRKVYPYIAITATLERTIRAAYDAKETGERYYVGPEAPKDARERLAAMTPDNRERNSIIPGSPSVVVDADIAESAAESNLSTSEFGELGDDVSEIRAMTPLEREAAGIGSPGPRDRKRILVVDDEEDIRKLVRRLLTEKGHEVIEAERGLLALAMVKQQAPDLILLDAMLPELHGFDIARRIKGSEKYGGIPILMMSAVYRGWRIAEDLKTNYGIEDYIEKPFRIADLLGKVQKLLTREVAAAADTPEEITAATERYLHEGIEAYKKDEMDLAIVLLKKGIAIDPLAYRLRYHLALIYGKLGLFYDAITELERAVDLNPSHFPALKNLAVLYEKAGFKNKAVEMWERSAHAAPDVATKETIKQHLMRLL
jgi:DNA-binding response OmpR family regulator